MTSEMFVILGLALVLFIAIALIRRRRVYAIRDAYSSAQLPVAGRAILSWGVLLFPFAVFVGGAAIAAYQTVYGSEASNSAFGLAFFFVAALCWGLYAVPRPFVAWDETGVTGRQACWAPMAMRPIVNIDWDEISAVTPSPNGNFIITAASGRRIGWSSVLSGHTQLMFTLLKRRPDLVGRQPE